MFFKKNYQIIFALIIFLISATYITYPLIFHLGDLVTGFGDELLIAWVLNWNIHALLTNPLTLFDTNIFFPFKNTLAYSDIQLTSSVISAPIVFITGEPISAVNFILIYSLILLPFGIFLLSYYITKNFFASLIAGLLVVFSPAVLDKKIHLQILAIEWIPFSIVCFLKFVEKKRYVYLVLTCFFFLVQTLNSFMAGYFLVLFYATYAIYDWFFEKNKLKKLINKRNVITLSITILLLIPFIIPYFKVSSEFNYTRDIRETIHFALQPEDMIYPSDDTRLAPILKSISNLREYPANAEIKPGYLGFVFSFLFIYSIYYFIKNKNKKDMHLFNTFFISSILGLLLSFGPFLHFDRLTIHEPFPIPLPYLPFYYLAPGFSGFRNSARFEMMFIIFISIPIAIMLARTFLVKTHKLKIIFFAVVSLLVVVEYNFPMFFYPVKSKSEFPKAYEFLNSTPKDSKIIIMPIFNWNMWGAAYEMEREYYSTVSFRKMVNGASGFSPPPWQKIVLNLHDSFPNNDSINLLSKLGVNYILIDSDKYNQGNMNKQEKYNSMQVISLLNKNKNLSFVKKIEEFYVYKIQRKRL